MPIFTLGYVYQLSDFATTGGNIVPPDEQGATAQGSPPFQMTLNPGFTSLEVLVDDDDPNFQETNGADSNQFLAADIVIDGVLYEAGQRVVLNYELTDANGFQGYSVTILPFGSGNSGSNDTTFFMTNAPMQAGQTYTFITEGNIGGGLGRPYADFVCFTAGGMIDTPDGMRRVETLRPGDRVTTRDRGAQPIRWIGTRMVPGIGRMAPIEIAQGHLGALRPHRVSPQHRLLVSGADVQMVTGETEGLATALHLVDGTAIRQVPTGFVTYVHIATDAHDLVQVDGVWSETLMVGPRSLNRMTDAQHTELTALFPLAPVDAVMDIARPQLKRHEAMLVA